MGKKKIIVGIVVIVFLVIFILWISGIIPREIAKFSASNYLKKNFPEKKYEYVNIEWNSYLGGYTIEFKDENNETVSFVMNNKYFPINPGQGIFALEEEYRIEHEGISNTQ